MLIKKYNKKHVFLGQCFLLKKTHSFFTLHLYVYPAGWGLQAVQGPTSARGP